MFINNVTIKKESLHNLKLLNDYDLIFKTDKDEIKNQMNRIILACKKQLSDKDIFFEHIIGLVQKMQQQNFSKLIDLYHIKYGISIDPNLQEQQQE